MTTTRTVQPSVDRAPTTRLTSIDLVRGAVMVLMAIDHVRVFSGVPPGGPSTAIFFTRWVTHFCAPAFIFLAGTSAFLYSRTHSDVGRYLVTRGMWLILLELTVLRIAWTFNLGFMRYNMAGVIWVIGWCMILLALLSRLPLKVIGAFGLVVIAGHNLLDPYLSTIIPAAGESSLSGLWKILYLGFAYGPIGAGGSGPQLWVLYSIVPWVGVIAAGFAFGSVMTLEPALRKRVCLIVGLSATALFLVLRGFNLYGDPQPWKPPLLGLLNTNKYPASLSFLLMTLGPTITVLALNDNARGAVARWLTVFGRVPFFYYVLHIPLIHVLAILVSRVRMGEVSSWLFADHPMGPPPPPEGYMWSLPLLYAVWAVAIVMLYFASRWFADLKARSTNPWLRYF